MLPIKELSYIFYFLMIFGVIASSISGAIRAIEAKMDITGAMLLAFLNSNSGGTIRDLLLNVTIFWIADETYIWLTLITGAITFIFIYYNIKLISNKNLGFLLILSDSFGLSSFCIAGISKATALNQSNITAILMGILTAVGGGIVADIVTKRLPMVLFGELYITVAFLGSILFIFLKNFTNLNSVIISVLCTVFMILLRLYSVRLKWQLPKIK